jgi:hypothetical protein
MSTTAWNPVRKPEDVPERRVVQVMVRGGAEHLAVRFTSTLDVNIECLKGPHRAGTISVSMIISADGCELKHVIAWRDPPSAEPLPDGLAGYRADFIVPDDITEQERLAA